MSELAAPNNYYYLTAEEMQHYRYMLASNYERELVSIGGQHYLVFPVTDKPYIWIVWPTTTMGLDGMSDASDTIFQPYAQLQLKLMPHITSTDVKVLLFPRYSS